MKIALFLSLFICLSANAADPNRLLNEGQLIQTIESLLLQNKLQEAAQCYRYFDCLTVDESIINHSNRVIDMLRNSGVEIIATTDPRREAKQNELVIVYGNYHHSHNNLPYTNKIWRHPLYYKHVTHTKNEYHPAWEPVGIIYIVNLKERVDRLQEILSELCRMQAPLHRIYHYIAERESPTGDRAIDLPAGCTKSHGNVTQHFLSTNHGHALVLEDDVTFTCDIEGNLERLNEFFKRNYEYDVCLLNSSKYYSRCEFDDLLLQSHQICTTTSAYLLSRKGALRVLYYFRDGYQKLIKYRNPWYTCDCYWSALQKENRFFLFKTKFGYQRCNYSTITGNTECHFD
jgi:Glycosyltransferase family 25 (LPS biosynthesis protein)